MCGSALVGQKSPISVIFIVALCSHTGKDQHATSLVIVTFTSSIQHWMVICSINIVDIIPELVLGPSASSLSLFSEILYIFEL